jgi:hypothetical protein
MHAGNRICGWFLEADVTQEHKFLGTAIYSLVLPIFLFSGLAPLFGCAVLLGRDIAS